MITGRISVTRDHSICCGHTVLGHEGKCANLHGHNYKITIEAEAPRLDSLGRVIDFGAIKHVCCEWLERQWDHKFLVFRDDKRAPVLKQMDPAGVVVVPFNPTAEEMAMYLLRTFQKLFNNEEAWAGCIKIRAVTVQETDKCAARFAVNT